MPSSAFERDAPESRAPLNLNDSIRQSRHQLCGYTFENRRPLPKIKNWFRPLFIALVLVLSWPACAHEFWMTPKPFTAAAGDVVALTLNVGQDFSGEQVPFYTALVASLRHYSVGASQDLSGRIPAGKVVAELPLEVARVGTHLIAFDSHPSRITMSPGKFHAYLHDEGLDAIAKKREAAGTADTPGRERFRRNVKSLLRVGGKSDATYAVRTGQRLEIVPLSDPLSAAPGHTLTFQVLFDNKPIVNALVKAWHKHDDQILLIKTYSTAEGKVAFALPYAGPWMLSLVHMIPVTDSQDADWDSYWGNLTFELPANATQEARQK